MLARPEIDLQTRRSTLSAATDSPQASAKLLMEITRVSIFEPDRTAKSITPLLLELPNDAVLAISDDLDKLLDNSEPTLRSAAVMLKVRSGAPLPALAERDPDALIQAVDTLPEDQAPANLASQMATLALEGKLNANQALRQAARLSTDHKALFDRLAPVIDKAQAIGFDQWSDDHKLAMAALGAMHQLPDEQWPDGFDAYRIERADEQTLALGHEVYYEEERGCVKCHGHHGEGTEGFPPLAGSPWVLGAPERGASIVKFGLMGELAHLTNPSDGKPYNAQMEPLSYLADAQIAAALTYTRQHFGNFASPVPAQVVANARRQEEGPMWQADALLQWYPFERDRVLGSMPAPQLKLVHWKPPPMGLAYVLGLVTLLMVAILVPTYFGGGQAPAHPAH